MPHFQKRILLAIAGWLWLTVPALAQASTYSLTAPNYTGVLSNLNCSDVLVGHCDSLDYSKSARLTFTLTSPIPANATNLDLTPLITSYVYDDGFRTQSGPSALTSINRLRISTDGAGNLTNIDGMVQVFPSSTYDTGVTSANARFQMLVYETNQVYHYSNISCPLRESTSAGSGPGNCNGHTSDSSSALMRVAVRATLSAEASTVPTLSEWAMILFGLLLAGGAALSLSQRRQPQ